eukprot:Lithocolla_globosa_v1_NODE_445_length_4026_cov_20.129438.p1 type:complete len:539 gc:universal NODE_445_length_4026_cov_20.129438:2260-3876(+)
MFAFKIRFSSRSFTNLQVRSLSSSFLSPHSQYKTRKGYLSDLDIWKGKEVYAKTSIICTIGPKTNSVQQLVQLRKNGMNVVRLNFSHGTFADHAAIIENTRKSFDYLPGRDVAIALDTKGPEIRTGKIKHLDSPIQLEKDKKVFLTSDPKFKNECDDKYIYVDYRLSSVLSPGKLVHLDDGLITLKVETVEPNEERITCLVLNSGSLGSNKGVNLPSTVVDLPSLCDYDRECLKWGVKQGVDIIFASFIRKADDVLAVRQQLGPSGQHMKIISKIENQEGLDNFDEILKVTDGIMVARGDLGIEIPPEKVFLAQKMMISRSNLAGKPVICATQMLESMTHKPRPTRAEVSDVANAVLDGADCVMLSGETANGNYPIQACSMMKNVLQEAEQACYYLDNFNETRKECTPEDSIETLCSSAAAAAMEQPISAIFVLTQTGNSARLVSKYRPPCPIVAVTRHAHVARTCHLYRGVYPFHYTKNHESNWTEDINEQISWAIEQARLIGIVKTGSVILSLEGWKGEKDSTNTMLVLTVPGKAS